MAEADKRIPVTKGVWEDLSNLKKPGQTFDELLAELIALKHERDFLNEMNDIEETGEFVDVKEVAQ